MAKYCKQLNIFFKIVHVYTTIDIIIFKLCFSILWTDSLKYMYYHLIYDVIYVIMTGKLILSYIFILNRKFINFFTR